jgi:hypothetical protein
MDDLISRQAAIDVIDVLCQEHRYGIPGKAETYSQYNYAWQEALGSAEGAIGNLPSAEPERKRGKWIPIQRTFFSKKVVQVKCSECGNLLDLIGVNCGRGDANYCPNCGAKMEGSDG